MKFLFTLFVFFIASLTVSAQTYTLAYITNNGSNNVTVINTATNSVLKTISVGTQPDAVAVSPDGSKVYVANDGSDNISVISTNNGVSLNNTVTQTISLGFSPGGIAFTPDGTKAYVANYSGNAVSVINVSTNSIITSVPVGNSPYGIAVSPDGSKVYVANSSSNTVSVISTATNTVTNTIAVGTGPFGVVFSPDGTKAYIANDGTNTVSVINTATNTIFTTITVGSNPYGLAISSDGSKLYAANSGSNTVSVINTTTNTITTTVLVGSIPEGLSITPDNSNVYVANNGSNNINTINTTTNGVSGSVTVGTSPIAFGNFIVRFTLTPPAASTTTTLNSSQNPTVQNHSVTLTATVSSTSTVGEGTVTFKDGSNVISGCGSQPVSNGSTTCTTSFSTVATHSLTAVYNGTANFSTSTSTALNEQVNSPLPVGLISFNAVLTNNTVNLNWTTASEYNNRGFEVQRMALGRATQTGTPEIPTTEAWKDLGFIPGAGNSTKVKNYNFTDHDPSGGDKILYRLQQMDIDGKLTYSDIAEISLAMQNALYQNYPNPFSSSSSIYFSIQQPTTVSLIIYNMEGKPVANVVNQYLSAGFYSVPFDGARLASGIYTYKLQAGGLIQVKRMLIMR